MEASQNMIHNASFNFEYGNAASAARGNILIENIFDSHILPQLDLAISSQIPKGLYIELSKLEINIGSINEKDLLNNLAERIKTALEDALKTHTKTGNYAFSENTASGRPHTDILLLKSIEIYLRRGYFLFGMDHSGSIDELVKQAIIQHKKEFIAILNQHRRKEDILKRIVHNLNIETFDLLLQALEPNLGKWSIEFRQILHTAGEEAKLNQQTGDEFVRIINYLSLNFILNENRSEFDKSKFTRSVISELRSIYKADFQMLLQAIQKSPNPISREILEQTEKQTLNQETVNEELGIKDLLELLNSENLQGKTFTNEFLKTEFIRSIRKEENRKQFIKKLNQSGIRTILSLFSNNNAAELFELISELSKAIDKSNKAFQLHEIALNTVEYLSRNTIRSFSPEELTLFLIYSAGTDGLKIINSASFRSFVQAQKKLDLKKIQSLMDDEARTPEIFAIQKILRRNRQSGPSEDRKAIVLNPEDYLIIPKRKIIGYYLRTGRLPDAYSDLSRTDVQTIFGELILLKDDFLAKLLHQVEQPNSLIQSILQLIKKLHTEELEAYFVYYFRKESDILSGIINQIPSDFRVGSDVGSDSLARLELLISSLAKSKGGSLPEAFLFSVLSGLNSKLSIDSDKFKHWLLSDSEIPEIVAMLNQENSGMELKRMLEHDFKQLTNKLHLSVFGTNQSEKEIQELIKGISFYFEIDQKYFLDHLQQNAAELPRVYAALKSHLNQELWNKIENGLLSKPELKREIEQKAKANLIPNNLQKENPPATNWLNQLLSHPPQVKSAQIDRNFWESLVSDFALPYNSEATEISTNILAGSFFYQLLQKLKAINEEEQFYPILEQMKSSESKELMALADYWEDTKILISNISENEEEEPESSKNTSHQLSILRFYAINGIFPWWAGQVSFPELLSGLAKISRQHPTLFEDSVLRLEKEEPILELLISKTPESVVKEFSRLFVVHTELNELWKQILKNKKTGIQEIPYEKSLLLKEIYHSADEQSFNKWLNGHPEISDQIKEYLLLAPFFYFRNMNPGQWRKAVYQFSLDYYGLKPVRLNNRFPSDFLNYLKRTHSNVDWNESLSTVYELVHSPNAKVNAVFPEALIPLIPIQKKPKASDNQEVIILQVEEGEEVKIYNSGLILFWPFLTRLFEILSLIKNGEFIDTESKNRAVFILQYLVYNEIDFPEHQLVLNKLLAGIQPEEHLVPLTSLTDEETDSTKSLLNGMINNWEKLQNTSPEGLQESFIQREGILKFQKDKVTLVVETKGFDILLQSLPWNISLVKLSWMKIPIYVEWI